MQLSQEDQEQITEWLNELNVTLCPVCRSQTNRTMSDRIYELREFGPQKRTVGVVPVIAAACKQCGHLVLFDAVQLGLLGGRGKGDG